MYVDELSVFTNTETGQKRFCYMYNPLWDTLNVCFSLCFWPRFEPCTANPRSFTVMTFKPGCAYH